MLATHASTQDSTGWRTEGRKSWCDHSPWKVSCSITCACKCSGQKGEEQTESHLWSSHMSVSAGACLCLPQQSNNVRWSVMMTNTPNPTDTQWFYLVMERPSLYSWPRLILSNTFIEHPHVPANWLSTWQTHSQRYEIGIVIPFYRWENRGVERRIFLKVTHLSCRVKNQTHIPWTLNSIS